MLEPGFTSFASGRADCKDAETGIEAENLVDCDGVGDFDFGLGPASLEEPELWLVLGRGDIGLGACTAARAESLVNHDGRPNFLLRAGVGVVSSG